YNTVKTCLSRSARI
ncbi:hypothetical protein CP03DC35_1111, partial [Chlamydia psittaci 03DC35]